MLVRTWLEEDIKDKRNEDVVNGLKVAGCIAILGIILMIIFLLTGCAQASDKVIIKVPNIEGYSAQEWCNAIFWAEGGYKTNHPYGILTKYKHTSPRQACINTVSNNHARWLSSASKLPYIAFLSNRYAPIGAKNDPGGLNKNWVKNVTYYLHNPKGV